MPRYQHHAIIVTSFNEEKIKKIYKKTLRLFENKLVSNLVEGVSNTYFSFFIAPDGSKEGWLESQIYDEKRKKLIKYIDSFKYSDGSNAIQYVEVSFGDAGSFISSTNEFKQDGL